MSVMFCPKCMQPYSKEDAPAGKDAHGHCSQCARAVALENHEILRQAAREALQVQDACNLTGVLHTMLQQAQNLKRLPQNSGTEWLNKHPVMQMFASKVQSLCCLGMDSQEEFARAYRECKALAEEKR